MIYLANTPVHWRSDIPPRPTKCDCRTPIWRFIDGAWQCLNCPLHDAIHLHRDTTEQQRLLALIDTTREMPVAR